MTFDIKQLQSIVREAGKILKDARVNGEGVGQKQGDANFVTVYDVQIQQFLMEKLSRMIPEAAFFGEEDTDGNQAGRLGDGFTFIIDPIDGTTNFLFDYHYSCISVAVAWGGALVAGCIYNPYLDHMYVAIRGLGCYLNGRRLKMEDLPVERGIVAFGAARYNNAHVDLLFDVVKNLFQKCLAVRSGGSAALDLAKIASGSNVAYVELLLQPYDYAAAAVMIEEAGGRIVQMDGRPITLDRPCSILAGTKSAVAQILQTIREEKAK
jgi:myo-inositol-1(or 4)-monophosphatase